MAKVGQLVVELAASTAKFQADLGRANAIAERHAKFIRTSLNSAVAAVGVGAFTTLIKGSIDAADALNDMSIQFGASVETLAGLKLAADQSGTSIDGIARGLKALSKEISGAPENMRALGVTTKDSTEAMIQLADVFASMPADADRTALAMQLFGKAGAEMIPLLAGGSAELRRMVDEGTRLNGVTTESARRADEFNDQLAVLKGHAAGVGQSLSNKLLGPLNDIVGAMVAAAKESGLLKAALVGLGGVFDSTFRAIGLIRDGQVSSVFDKTAASVDSLNARAEKLRGTLNSMGGTKPILGESPELRRMKTELASLDALIAARNKPAAKPVEPKQNTPQLAAASCIAAGGKFKDGKCVMPGSGGRKSGGAKAGKVDAPEDVFEDGGFIASRENADFIRKQFDDVNDLQRELYNESKNTNEELARQVQRFKDMADPLEPLRRELEELDGLYKQGAISAETWAEATFKVQEKMNETFGTIKEEGKEAFDELKAGVDAISSAFEEFIRTGKLDFKSFIKSIVADAASAKLKEVLGGIFGGKEEKKSGGGQALGLLSAVFGGFRADGGPVSAGTSYIVGERGPELFTPRASGSISPNGGGATFVTNIDARGADAGVLPRIQAMLDANNRKLEAKILDSRRRGGAFA